MALILRIPVSLSAENVSKMAAAVSTDDLDTIAIRVWDLLDRTRQTLQHKTATGEKSVADLC